MLSVFIFFFHSTLIMFIIAGIIYKGLTDTRFLGLVLTPISGSKKITKLNISAKFSYQIVVTKLCNGG